MMNMFSYNTLNRIVVTLLILYVWGANPMQAAPIYTTSSVKMRSTSPGGLQPSVRYHFHSTSGFTKRNVATYTPSRTYSTAPMFVANGTVRTVASDIVGGTLTEQPAEPARISPRQRAVIPGTPDLPIGEGWDVALLLSMMCAIYIFYVKTNLSKRHIEK